MEHGQFIRVIGHHCLEYQWIWWANRFFPVLWSWKVTLLKVCSLITTQISHHKLLAVKINLIRDYLLCSHNTRQMSALILRITISANGRICRTLAWVQELRKKNILHASEFSCIILPMKEVKFSFTVNLFWLHITACALGILALWTVWVLSLISFTIRPVGFMHLKSPVCAKWQLSKSLCFCRARSLSDLSRTPDVFLSMSSM